MESARRQTLWYLLRADTGDARRARQRLAVGTCLALLLAGLLAAVGLAIVVVASCVLFAGTVAAAAAVRALRRHGGRLSSSARRFASHVHRTLARHGSRAHHHAKRVPPFLAESAARAEAATVRARREHGGHLSSSARRFASHAHRTLARHGSRVRHHAKRVPGFLVEGAARAEAAMRQVQLSAPRHPIDVQRQALRLNAAGTNERRRGAYAEAVDLHTRALVLLRDVHDPHAVALTQNNLALALSHVGDDPSAISLFEQAAGTLRALGDKENEGKIMANLALAHRRHGRTDESANVLRLALTKLERDSSAYALVEAELRRAS